jgi:hypothetical protein
MAARLWRLPRPVRLCLTFMCLGWAFALLVVPLGALFLLPFDPPGILGAGRFQAAVGRLWIPISLLFSVPLMTIMALDEDMAVWRTLRGAAGRLLTWLVLAPFTFVFGVIPVVMILKIAAPFLANAILLPPVQDWTVPIDHIVVRKPAPKRCDKELFIDDWLAPGHGLNLCAEHDPALADARLGDRLRITGRSGPFGITYSRAELVRSHEP